jgi:lysophospholipase L1-like esterase
MAASHFHTAEYPRPHFDICSSARRWVKAPLAIILLGLLMFFLVACSIQSNQQSSTTNSTTAAQQQAKGQLTYVAIGASDTFGLGSDDPYNQNWAADLAAKLGPKYHLINLGVPSITIHEALRVELPVALDAHPNLVTIWLAANDIIDNVPVNSYAQDLDTLLSRLQSARPHVRIAVANVPDLTLLPYFYNQRSFNPQVLQAVVRAYNTAIATIVKRHHALLIDLSQHNFDIQNHPEYISEDGLHPTDIGYAQLANLFYQTLQKAQE